ncbi:MAG: DegT/DnrJ/EryC1/StrS family aminotransferase [Candidatus Methylomirabilota bacterium]
MPPGPARPPLPSAGIPHSRPQISPADVRAVARVVRSGLLAQGAEVAAFEREIGGFLGLPPGVAVSSGTAALHLALVGLGIGPGDEVILPSYVCVAPLHAIEHVGATACIADIDPSTYNLDPRDVRRRLTRRTKAIITPHLFGLPADLDPLLALGIPVIEDCAQALGATLDGRPVGSFGSVGVLSFYATKLLATGEGGMLVSRDPRLLSRLRDLRDYDERRRHRPRFNYKLTDMQAALGRSQLGRFPAMLARRRAIAARYGRQFRTLSLGLPPADARRDHAFHRFVVAVPGAAITAARQLESLGVRARRPIFQPLHATLSLPGFPGTRYAHRHALSIPIYPGLQRHEEATVVAAIRSLFA